MYIQRIAVCLIKLQSKQKTKCIREQNISYLCKIYRFCVDVHDFGFPYAEEFVQWRTGTKKNERKKTYTQIYRNYYNHFHYYFYY